MKTLNMEQFAERMLELTPSFMRRVMQHEQSDITRGVLTEPQFWGLEFLLDHGPCPVHELAEALHLQLSSTSGLVDRLVKMGMVNRKRSKDDRRVVLLSLTAKGKKTVRGVLVQKRESFKGICKPLSPKERHDLVAIIQKMIR